MSEKSVNPEIMCQACVYFLSILRGISNAYLFMQLVISVYHKFQFT